MSWHDVTGGGGEVSAPGRLHSFSFIWKNAAFGGANERKKKKKQTLLGTVNFLNSQLIEFLLILAPTFHNKCQSFLTEI